MQLMCSMLYWCEGAKNPYGGVRFTNSDPSLIKKFLNLFRTGFFIEERKFRVCAHLHEYHDMNKQIRFWSEITDISAEQFIKPYLKPHTGKRIRDGYNGCVSIYYHDVKVQRKLLAIAKAYLGV